MNLENKKRSRDCSFNVAIDKGILDTHVLRQTTCQAVSPFTFFPNKLEVSPG
jgi:hypothetical protein